VPLAIGTTVLRSALTYLGADAAIRAQYVVMAVLGAAIVSVLGGAIGGFSHETLAANGSAGFSSRDITFWPVLALGGRTAARRGARPASGAGGHVVRRRPFVLPRV